MARPKYEVLEKCFIAPHTLMPGSIITMTGEPADHLKPLNDEAKAEMEKWYDKEYTHIDERTGQMVKSWPNKVKRPQVAEAKTTNVVHQLHAAPKPGTDGEIIPLLDRPLQPDLTINPDDGIDETEAASFDGDVQIEHAVVDETKKAS